MKWYFCVIPLSKKKKKWKKKAHTHAQPRKKSKETQWKPDWIQLPDIMRSTLHGYSNDASRQNVWKWKFTHQIDCNAVHNRFYQIKRNAMDLFENQFMWIKSNYKIAVGTAKAGALHDERDRERAINTSPNRIIRWTWNVDWQN